MPTKFILTATAAVISGGAAWYALAAVNSSIPISLPVFAITVLVIGLVRRSRRTSVNP
jgi:hypothetical protein